MRPYHLPAPLLLPLLLAAVASALTLPAAGGTVDTRNLLRNGDFEEAAPPLPGWTLAVTAGGSWELSGDALTGSQALQMSLPPGATVNALSAPVPVGAGGAYVLSFWARADGAQDKGGTGYSYLLWQDAAGKALTTTLVHYFNPVPDYQACIFTAAAPVGATQVVLQLTAGLAADYQGPPTVFLFDQVRLMKLTPAAPGPPAPRWQYLCRQLRTGLKMVPDQGAAQGQAITAELATAVKGSPLTWGQYTREQPAGDYLLLFRLKVKDNTKREPVAALSVTDIGSFNYSLAPGRTLLATDFAKPGEYQDFAIRYVRPEQGMLEFTATWLGATDLTFDCTTVVQLDAYTTDQQLQAVWLGE